jgi:hypothetical protein
LRKLACNEPLRIQLMLNAALAATLAQDCGAFAVVRAVLYKSHAKRNRRDPVQFRQADHFRLNFAAAP